MWEKKKENYLVFNLLRTALVFNFNLAVSVKYSRKMQYSLWLVYFKWRSQDRVYAKIRQVNAIINSARVLEKN